MIQETVWIVTLLLMAIVCGAFIFVAINASKPALEYAEIQASSMSARKKFFWVLLGAGVIITFSTLQTLPYAASKGATDTNDIVIDVVGKQWYWEMSQTEAKVGDTIVFNVSSTDVNHGFGIYDENLNMLGQTQAMPGYSNKLRFTFDQAGEYKLLCMEYCGLAHHTMVMPFTVETP